MVALALAPELALVPPLSVPVVAPAAASSALTSIGTSMSILTIPALMIAVDFM